MKASNIAGVIAAVVCLILAAWYLLFNNTAPERPPYPGDEYAIRAMSEGAIEVEFLPTGSMGAALNENHIAYVRKVPFGEVRDGDIVLFATTGGPVAHRAIGRNNNGDIITKGDANAYKDAEPVTRGNYIGVIREEEIFLRP